MKTHYFWLTLALVGLCLLLFALHSSAQVVEPRGSPSVVQRPSTPLEFKACGESPVMRFKRNGNDVEVYCVGESVPVFTLKGCVEPKVSRVGGMYKVLCVRWIPHDVVPRAAPQ
jgi:hypothetical protein